MKNILIYNTLDYETKIISNFINKGSCIYEIMVHENKKLPNLCLKIVYEVSEGWLEDFKNEIEIMKSLTDEFLITYKTPHLMMYINDYNNNDNLGFVKKILKKIFLKKKLNMLL